MPLDETQPSSNGRGLATFFLVLLVLAGVSFALAFLPIPTKAVLPLTWAVAALFIAGPVFALFRAGEARWSPKMALGFLAGGLALQIGLSFLSVYAFGGRGAMASVCTATSQIGLMLWCVGLGAMLATLLKEKNLLIPVSVFLAAFDIFLVLTPIGPTKILLQVRPELLAKGGWTVPKVADSPTFGPVAATAYIGPADFVFMAMFAVAIYRFGLRPRQTILALIPALVAYLAFVFLIDAPLPAMVPIGLAVLAVNWPEFRLTKEEWASTALVAAIGIGLIAWGATRPAPRVELLPLEAAPERAERRGSPALGPQGRSP